jgi:hypothetical protein
MEQTEERSQTREYLLREEGLSEERQRAGLFRATTTCADVTGDVDNVADSYSTDISYD